MATLIWTMMVAVFLTSGATAEVNQTCARVATFNTGLSSTLVDHKDTRKPLIFSNLVNNSADVYCLTELFLESELEDLLNKTSCSYPYHFSPLHYKVGQLRCPSHEHTVDSACTKEEKTFWNTTMKNCMLEKGCLKTEYDKFQVAECSLEACGPVLYGNITDECLNCRMSFSPDGPFDDAEECHPNACVPHNRYNHLGGLVLLSKRPITNVRTEAFHVGDQLWKTGYIEADVENIGKVVCAALTYDYGYKLEVSDKFPNLTTRQRVEVETLIDGFKYHKDVIVAGVFNTGPEVPTTGVKGENADNYDLLVNANYTNEYVSKDGRCTYCGSNEYSFLDKDNVLDYVLTKGFFEPLNVTRAKRIFDQTLTGDGPDHLSKQFGVEIEVCPRTQCAHPGQPHVIVH